MPKHLRFIVCSSCNKETLRRSGNQKYCAACSEDKAVGRNNEWARAGGRRRIQEKVSLRGRLISAKARAVIWTLPHEPNLIWVTKIAIPFSWASSKNHIWSTSGGYGHVVKRENKKRFQEIIIKRLSAGLPKADIRQNKLWVSIFMQKPNHRGDAINSLDTICDAIKVATGIDDRWFSVKNLDWQIVKTNPMIFISVGQEAVQDVRACSSCGQLLTFDFFQSNRADRHGISRNCRLCARDEDSVRRKRKNIGGFTGKDAKFNIFW